MNKLPAGWKLSRLEELATVERGKFSARPRNDPKFFGGDVPFVQTGDVSAAGTYLFSHKQTLNELGKTVSKTFPRGSILITIAANIGETAITTYEVACPDSVVAIIPKPAKAHVFWLKKALETLKDDLDSKATQNAQKNINLELLRPLEIMTPPIEEQTKIAQILSTWDKAISITKRLFINRQQQKYALMQQLLTGRRRLAGFNKNWEDLALGQLFSERNETNRPDLTLLSITTEQGVIDRADSGKKDTSSEDKSKYRRICPGDIGYNTMRMWQGVSGLSDKEGIVSPAYTILQPTALVDSKFASYLFKTPTLIHIFMRHSQGLVSDTWNLKYEHFAKIKVFVPCVAEQQKIAQVLSTADAEIANLQAQLEKLKLEKKALMQQLLTGKRRVRLDDEEEGVAPIRRVG